MDNTIALRISLLLMKSRKRQKDLAAHLGVTDNTISYFVSGKRTPNIEQIIKIAQYFGVSTDYILGVSDAETNDKDVQFICDYTGLSESSIKILNNFKESIKFDFLNHLIRNLPFLAGVEYYKDSLKEERKYIDDSTDKIDKFISRHRNLPSDISSHFIEDLRGYLKSIDEINFNHFKIIEEFKDCLNDFTSGNRKALDKKRSEIREAILKLEVKEYADNNEA